MRARLACVAGALALGALGCRSKESGSAPLPSPSTAVVARDEGDAERGRALVARFECSRCHDGTGAAEAAPNKHCFHCHDKIALGVFEAPEEALARWRGVVLPFRVSPSLTGARRFKRSWLTSFLREPHDLRPRLVPTMPRLALGERDANDIAAHLGAADEAERARSLEGANAARGRALMEAKGCLGCHVFSGAFAAPRVAVEEASAAVALAPDLRWARDRLTPAGLIAWLLNPKAMKPDTLMPEVALTAEEARDIAAYVMTAELALPKAKEPPARLPLLGRPVTFEEVDKRIFHKTCWHCHSEPDYALGDGGPGNTGGFGFSPRGLNLADYGSMTAGFIDDRGERRSVFEPLGDAPRIVASLLARHDEEAGRPRSDIRGMPLGLPALSPEEIQLLESWIAQGRPR